MDALYKSIFSRKTNPRDHEMVSLLIKGFDFLQKNIQFLTKVY